MVAHHQKVSFFCKQTALLVLIAGLSVISLGYTVTPASAQRPEAGSHRFANLPPFLLLDGTSMLYRQEMYPWMSSIGTETMPNAPASNSTYHWIANTTPNVWSVATNWALDSGSGNVSGYPNAIGDTANFFLAQSNNRTVTIPTATTITVGTISLATNKSWTVCGASTDGSLIFDVSSGSAAFNLNGTVVHGGDNLQCATTLNDPLIIDTAASNTLTIFGGISGANGITKNGAGTVRYQPPIAGTNNYSGTTTITDGIFMVDTDLSSSPFSLTLSGTLAGGSLNNGATNGTTGALTATGGTIAPGSNTGGGTQIDILNVNGGVTMNSSTTFAAEISGTTAGAIPGYDQLNVVGGVSLGNATLSVTVDTSSHTPAVGEMYTIINNDASDAVVGQFSGLPNNAAFVVGSTTFRINYDGGTNSNDVVLTVIPSGPAGTAYTWNINSAGDWNVNANWLPNTGFPNAINDSATFGNVTTGVRLITIPDAVNITVGSVIFDHNKGYNVTSGTGTLTFNASPVNAALTKTAAAANHTLSVSSIILNTDLTITNQAADGSTTLTVSGAISGNHNVITAGTGLINFVSGGANTYTGTTTVSSGTLVINKSTASSAFLLMGGLLGGDGGTTGGITATGGTFSAGDPGGGVPNAHGLFNANGNTSFASPAVFKADLAGTTAGTGYDQLNVTGTVTLNNPTLTVTITPPFVPAINDTFTIINNDGSDAVTGRFAGLPNNGSTFTVGSTTFSINYAGGTNGNDVVLTVVPAGATAARTSVSGRVVSADGHALRGVRVTLDGGNGHSVTATSNAFGYYYFDAVQSGNTYLVSANARGYVFAPRLVSINDQLSGLDITALP